MKKFIIIAFIIVLSLPFSACATDADIASDNLSLAAEQFKIVRRIIFLNGITDQVLLEVVGTCSIESNGNAKWLEVVCKGEHGYYKHFLGLSDNVTFFAEQLYEEHANVYHYDVLIKPESVIPSFDLVTSLQEK